MTVMAVDSNSDRLKGFVKQLKSIFPNEKIDEFINPLMAMKYSFNNPVDIIFTDILMQVIDGFILSEGIHQYNPDAKVFFLADTDEYKETAIERGYSSCFVRPIDIGEVKKIVMKVIN